MSSDDEILSKIGSLLKLMVSEGDAGVKITLDVLTSMFGSKNKDQLAKFVDPLNKYLPLYGIVTKADVSAFLGQVGHESSGFMRLSEGLNYSAQRLIEVFPRRFTSKDPAKDAELRKKAEAIAHNEQATANYIYSGIIGNGIEASGDGWTFRGAGAIQLTGRDNHAAFAKHKGIDVKKVGDYARTPEGAVETACFFWKTNGLSALANKGDLKGLTSKVNTACLGLKERTELAEKAMTLLA